MKLVISNKKQTTIDIHKVKELHGLFINSFKGDFKMLEEKIDQIL